MSKTMIWLWLSLKYWRRPFFHESFKDRDLPQLPGCLQHPVHVKNSALKTKHAVILCSSEYIRTKRWSGFRGFQTSKRLTLPGLETVCDTWQPSVTRETCILASLLVLGKISNKEAAWKPLDCFDWWQCLNCTDKTCKLGATETKYLQTTRQVGVKLLT